MVSVVLCLVVAWNNIAYADDTVPIETICLDSFDKTANEWYETDSSRIQFAAIALTDILLQQNERVGLISESFLGDEIFVAQDGFFLVLYCFGESGTLILSHAPIVPVSTICEIDPAPVAGKYIMEVLREDDVFQSFYHVDAEKVYQELNDFMLAMASLLSE